MSGAAAGGGEPAGVPRTLAEKVRWLIHHARPAGGKRLSDNDIVLFIFKVTGEQVSNTTILKLRNGENKNPQLRVIEALAKTFGVPTAFFFDDFEFDAAKAGLLADQVELLALVREAGITAPQFRALLGISDEGRQVVADLIARTARTVAGEHSSGAAGEHGGS